MTQISDEVVGYPRLYLDPHRFGMHTIFLAPGLAGCWLAELTGGQRYLSTAFVESEEKMSHKWPNERLVTSPAAAKAYLRHLADCQVSNLVQALIDQVGPNWRHSWEQLA